MGPSTRRRHVDKVGQYQSDLATLKKDLDRCGIYCVLPVTPCAGFLTELLPLAPNHSAVPWTPYEETR